MHRFQITPEKRIRATATTRVGLVTAAVQGLFDAVKPTYVEDSKLIEQPFKVVAADFAALLTTVLNEGIRLSKEKNEAYENVRFSLITDKVAEGIFIGRTINGYGQPVSSATIMEKEVAKNIVGLWEATVALDA